MKTISEGNSNVNRLLGTQQCKDTTYRVMTYTLQNRCDDGLLLHNTITGKMVLLNKEEEALIGLMPCARTDLMTELIKDYFLVPVTFNERDTVHKLRLILKRMLVPEGIKGYTILTTTNCNARCFYCYENELPHINMDEATANQLVDYMALNKSTGPLELHWFGGEPLVCVNRIDQICESLRTRSIPFVSSMTSNGYLFTEQMIERAASSWNLKSVQITLDGTENVYNKTKSYVSVSGSPYQRVLSNIKLLLMHRIRVIIRLNLDMHNIEDLQTLVSELDQSVDEREYLEVYAHVLFEDAGFAPIERNAEIRSTLYSALLEINNQLSNLGLAKTVKSLPFLKTHNCMADIENSVVVYPDGHLYKCEHIVLEDEIGDICCGETKEAGIKKFQQTTEMSECPSCPLYPSCILLRNCQGISDKNHYTCKHDIEMITKSLPEHYRRLSNQDRTNTSLNISGANC